MKQKHVEFPHRTRQEWLQLAEKYFEAETSDEEERQLKLFLCSAEAQDPAFDELKAVMGYLAVGKSRYRQQNEKRSSFQAWKWRSIAAASFSVVCFRVRCTYSDSKNGISASPT